VHRRPLVPLSVLLVAAFAIPVNAQSPLDQRTSNMTHIASIPYESGTDLAFFDHYAIAGDNGEADAGFHIIDIADPAHPKIVSEFHCVGSQNDVSVWRRLAFVSVDGRRANTKCDAAAGGTTEGVRVVDISDLKYPRQIAFVQTDCGSHTHTLVPDEAHNRVLVYVLSYPLSALAWTGPGDPPADPQSDAHCSFATQKKISVIEVPLSDPTKAHVVSTPTTAPMGGCHDVTIFAPRKLAAAACLNEVQIWDVADPVNPKIVSHFGRTTAAAEIFHSTAWSWDGNTIAVGDEAGGFAGPACFTGKDPLGAIWFVDVSDPTNPVRKSWYSLPHPWGVVCTAHNFNVIPVPEKDILVAGFYNGGVSVIDFTDPTAPHEIGYYRNWGDPIGPPVGSTVPDVGPVSFKERGLEVWSAYWYNGTIYANGATRGFDVYRFDDPVLAGAMKFSVVNAQTQMGLPKPKPAPAKSRPRVLGRTTLPNTGVGSSPIGAVLLAAAVAAVLLLRRGATGSAPEPRARRSDRSSTR
jgi:hypothetical protein